MRTYINSLSPSLPCREGETSLLQNTPKPLTTGEVGRGFKKSNHTMKKLTFLLTALLAAASGSAKVTLPKMFADGMVMQREADANLWGRADASATVKITTSWDNKTYTVKAGADGKWKTSVRTPEAGGPYKITLTDGQETVLDNILIGELWICSGQSNMEMPMKGFKNQPVEGAVEDILHSTDPQLRLFTVKRNSKITPVDTVSGQWSEACPASVREFSATAYYFGRELRRMLDVPVGLIVASWGGSACEAWMKADWLKAFPDAKIPATQDDVKSKNRTPTVLYNGMLHPLIGVTMRGVIWYQGESNAHNMEAHERLFRLLLQSWRQYWGNDSLPFFYAQLSSLNRPSWPWFRDSQRRLMTDLPACGMAVTSDVGDSLDVHPRQKRPVGRRLARWALNRVYGRALTPGGPLVKQAEARGRKVRLSFDYAEGLTTSDGQPLRTFEVAGPDGVFYPAQAVVRHDAVVVESPQVEEPCSVRYGWQPFTRANLVNAAGLPASTFRVAVRATGR